MKEKFEKMQNMMFVNMFYADSDIDRLIEEMKDLKINVVSNLDDEGYANFIGKQIGRMQILAHLFQTKKIQQNKRDFVKVGEYLHELANDLIEFGTGGKSEEKASSEEFDLHKAVKNFMKELFEEDE